MKGFDVLNQRQERKEREQDVEIKQRVRPERSFLQIFNAAIHETERKFRDRRIGQGNVCPDQAFWEMED